MLPKRLIRKSHPGGIKYSFQLNGVENLDNTDLLNVIDEAEILIYDIPTTAFNFGAATNKPIIYFDIGMRNLMPDALKSIKERCVYVKGSPKNSEEMVRKAFEGRNKILNNSYTTRYCLSKNQNSREKILFDIIDKLEIN